MALYNNPYQYSFGVPGQMNQFQQQPVQMPAQPVQQRLCNPEHHEQQHKRHYRQPERRNKSDS